MKCMKWQLTFCKGFSINSLLHHSNCVIHTQIYSYMIDVICKKNFKFFFDNFVRKIKINQQKTLTFFELKLSSNICESRYFITGIIRKFIYLSRYLSNLISKIRPEIKIQSFKMFVFLFKTTSPCLHQLHLQIYM